ncbi:hypothetical protein [Nannocystis pusilla]|uniref:hypothetical protein n=1 Tax=Nannocystis pusilla TaxID=889268 RepID=UPI003BF302C8
MPAPKFALPLPLLLALQSACSAPASDSTGTTGDATSGGESSDGSGPATADGTTDFHPGNPAVAAYGAYADD